ncbi:unnamed protein product [Rotaria socialis]|uniref:Uncharacterized protein n=1 Tax=Rotaria socialis TaxID=392032 RepID=A0A817S0Y7_9BILA|nr:unnamed protein product [Rotaria socialis]CAF3434024.1 unnamed protein product [Rotaria socialis]CAF4442868.1 unnamed protein product [Rotaria socialis]CAF4459841.1 unnamed protein product [Rotaria socialis]
MKRNSSELKSASGKRQSNASSVSIVASQQNGRRMSILMNAQRRSSFISQLSLCRSAEYRPQQRLPPNGLEYQQNVLLTNIAAAVKDNSKLFPFKSTKKSNSTQDRKLAQQCDVFDHEQKPVDDENSLNS